MKASRMIEQGKIEYNIHPFLTYNRLNFRNPESDHSPKGKSTLPIHSEL